MTTTSPTQPARYCEGCEATGHPLTAAGYCPICADIACGTGDGDQVALPVPADTQAAYDALNAHLTTSGCTGNGCLVCALATDTCPECQMSGTEMDADTYDEHLFIGGAVALGCEGYATPAVRAAALLPA